MNFELVDRLTIKDPTISLQETNNCFLYDFKGGGFTRKQFERWLDGKIMDIYEFHGRFGKSKKCPWCGEPLNPDLMCICMAFSGRSLDDRDTIKLSNHLYKLLLEYVRNENYETLGLFVHKKCCYCPKPLAEGRAGKCAIPESSRNKARSMKLLGLSCENFSIEDYTSSSVAMVYKRRPI